MKSLILASLLLAGCGNPCQVDQSTQPCDNGMGREICVETPQGLEWSQCQLVCATVDQGASRSCPTGGSQMCLQGFWDFCH